MKRLFFFCFLMLLPLLVLAQVAEPVAEAISLNVDWMAILPFIITAILIPVAVQLIKSLLMPNLSAGAKQILAMIAGPLLTPVGVWLSGLLGTTIDLTPIIIALGGALSGLLSMGVYDTAGKRLKKVFSLQRE